MKAVILAGGEGTRLRPLTLAMPKPVVPIVDRPLLQHQLDLLSTAGVTEVVFSVAYKPDRIERVFGDGRRVGRLIHYAVEETPLGTGGAVRNAQPFLDDTTIVFNGDVLTDVDLAGVVELHRSKGAAATIVLHPVPNPSAFGLVETNVDGRVRRFVEKPQDPSQITTHNINAGIYVLDTKTLSLIPPGISHSIERGFFPALIGRGDAVFAHVHGGYWIDVGTPEKYLQVHRDILRRRFPVALHGEAVSGGWVHPRAYVSRQARLRPPFFVGPGCRIAGEAEVGPDVALVADVDVAAGARIGDSVAWEGVRVGARAQVEGALLGPGVKLGEDARVGAGAVLGAGSVVSDHSRTVA